MSRGGVAIWWRPGPYWLGVDTRLIADEFFHGSYTTGAWLKGELENNVKYHVMVANNLSTLGVSAAQLDNQFNTRSDALQWLPTTGEFGLWGTYGDCDDHQKVATRVGWRYTHSVEDKQTQPGTEGIENSQIRLGGVRVNAEFIHVKPRAPSVTRRTRCQLARTATSFTSISR